MSKTLKTRVKQKTDSSSAWKTAGDNGFTPLKGEIIVYSDLNKMKVGDGTTNVNSLAFMNAATYDAANYCVSFS